VHITLSSCGCLIEKRRSQQRTQLRRRDGRMPHEGNTPDQRASGGTSRRPRAPTSQIRSKAGGFSGAAKIKSSANEPQPRFCNGRNVKRSARRLARACLCAWRVACGRMHHLRASLRPLTRQEPPCHEEQVDLLSYNSKACRSGLHSDYSSARADARRRLRPSADLLRRRSRPRR